MSKFNPECQYMGIDILLLKPSVKKSLHIAGEFNLDAFYEEDSKIIVIKLNDKYKPENLREFFKCVFN
tara:strand:+ start:1760 stop:1963 length:204 start_codon:yes stop_codon:yes gene_type:complete